MTPWRAAERAYYAHHFACRQCIGAGQQPGVLPRCAEGQALWQDYEAQPLPWVLAGRVGPGGVVLGGKSGGNLPPPPKPRSRF